MDKVKLRNGADDGSEITSMASLQAAALTPLVVPGDCETLLSSTTGATRKFNELVETIAISYRFEEQL